MVSNMIRSLGSSMARALGCGIDEYWQPPPATDGGGGGEPVPFNFLPNPGFNLTLDPWEANGWVWADGTATNDSAGESDQLRVDFVTYTEALIAGTDYIFSMDVISGTSFAVVLFTPGFAVLINGEVSVGRLEIPFTAADSHGWIFIRSNAGPGVAIDNVSIVEAA